MPDPFRWPTRSADHTEDCGELQVGALGVEPWRTKGLRVGICFLPIGDEQMMELVRGDDEAHAAGAHGSGSEFICEMDRRMDHQGAFRDCGRSSCAWQARPPGSAAAAPLPRDRPRSNVAFEALGRSCRTQKPTRSRAVQVLKCGSKRRYIPLESATAGR